MVYVKHTPRPWLYEESAYSCVLTYQGASIGAMFHSKMNGDRLPSEANAAHIVKCVNMHDELVEIVGDLICAGDFRNDCPDVKAAREILKKAGAL